MLKGIHPVVSPDLLAALSKMGHGDSILLSDAHFPTGIFEDSGIIRADGIKVGTLLEGILPLFELDQYSEYPVVMMQAVKGDKLDPRVEARYFEIISRITGHRPPLDRIERFGFYNLAKQCLAIVVTGETAKYGNIILKKGVISG